MAIGGNFPGFGPPLQPAPAQGLPSQADMSFQRPKPPIPKLEPGTLFIRDTFMPSFGGGFGGFGAPVSVPHGQLVQSAAGQQKQFDNRVAPSVLDEPRTDYNLPVNDPHLQSLGSKEMTKEEALQALSASTELKVTSFLDDQSDYLERVTKSGTENSVANFSLGQSKASLANDLYDTVLSSVTAPPAGEGGAATAMMLAVQGDGKHTRENYIKAFDIDVDKLKSEDPKVRGAEEKRLQQAIVDHVSQTVDQSKPIGQSRDRWDTAVDKFEQNNNSVVIAAGNEGDIEERLEKANGNNQLRLPKDFEQNMLENEQVTSVGATLPNDKGQQRPAAWSSVSGGVDIYADGTVPDANSPDGNAQGTSFAAPKVAATMAELHQRFPNLSSSQIETLMKNQLTQPVSNGSSGSIQVLDLSASLSSVTY